MFVFPIFTLLLVLQFFDVADVLTHSKRKGNQDTRVYPKSLSQGFKRLKI